MPIIKIDWITRKFVQSNLNKVFVFGDNLQRKGFGGQAREMRGEPNTIGIPTKKKPSNTIDSYFINEDFYNPLIMDVIRDDLLKIKIELMNGKDVIIPKNGIGTNLSKLQEKSPKIFDLIQTSLNIMENLYGTKL